MIRHTGRGENMPLLPWVWINSGSRGEFLIIAVILNAFSCRRVFSTTTFKDD
jgi:hypothetical protein